jgi:dihydropteroate synthase
MPALSTVPLAWHTAAESVRLDRPVVMGILNITPDSFWDGGRQSDLAAAVRHAMAMIEDGADIIDIGGESTRPGASVVPSRDEIARVVPVIEALLREAPGVAVSVDTVKAEVAAAALDVGAAIINDVSGLRLDPALAGVVARSDAGVVLMHSRGDVESMASYALAEYGADPAADVARELQQAVVRARAAGIPNDAIVLDPGLGFAKRTEHSLGVLAHLDDIAGLGFPVLVGPSRKRFVGDASGGLPVEHRLEGTLAACVVAFMKGARIFRVHDVRAARRALDLAAAVAVAASSPRDDAAS